MELQSTTHTACCHGTPVHYTYCSHGAQCAISTAVMELQSTTYTAFTPVHYIYCSHGTCFHYLMEVSALLVMELCSLHLKLQSTTSVVLHRRGVVNTTVTFMNLDDSLSRISSNLLELQADLPEFLPIC